MDKLEKKAASGDAEAFAQLVSALERQMYWLAWSYLGNDADAADAMQCALLKAWKNISGLKRAEAFNSWLLAILANQCRDMLDARREHADIDSLPQSQQPVIRDSYNPNVEFKALLAMAPAGTREALSLYYGDGYSTPEISTILSLSEENVRQRLSRGRKAIKQRLEKNQSPIDFRSGRRSAS